MSYLPTIRQQRGRINHERLLNFNGIDQHLLANNAGVNFGSNDFCVGFIIETSTACIPFQMFSGISNLFVQINPATTSAVLDTVESTQFSVTVNQSVLNRLTYVFVRRIGTEFSLFLNAVKSATATIPATDTVNFESTNLVIGSRIALTNNFVTGTMNNFFVVRASVSNATIRSIYKNGGFVPSELHSSILHHWPLSQKYYFNDAGTLKAWDVVSQYGNGNAPIHAALTNFTVSQVGGDQPANQNKVIDVYSKNISIDWGILFEDISGTRRVRVDANGNLISTSTNNFCFGLEFSAIGNTTESDAMTLLNDNGGNAWWDLRYQVTAGNLSIRISPIVPTGGSTFLRWESIPIEFNRTHKLLIYKSTDDANNWTMYFDGSLIPPQTVQNPGDLIGNDLPSYNFGSINSGFTNPIRQLKNTIVYRGFITNGLISDADRRNYFQNDVVPSNLLEDVNYGKVNDFTTLSVRSRFGNRPQVYEGFQVGQEDDLFRERQSGLPEIKEGLTLNSSRFISIPQTVFQHVSGEDIDIILEYKKGTIPVATTQDYLDFNNPIDNQRLLHRVAIENPVRLRSIFNVTGDSAQEFKDMVIGVDDQMVSLALALFKREAVSLDSGISFNQYENGIQTGLTAGSFGTNALPINWSNFTTNRLSGDMLFVSLTMIQRKNQRFNRRSFIKKWDNSLLSTEFDLEPGDRVIAHYNSNGASYFEDGVNVLLREYIMNDGTTDATVTGFSGATPADQFADLLTNIVTIDSLR